MCLAVEQQIVYISRFYAIAALCTACTEMCLLSFEINDIVVSTFRSMLKLTFLRLAINLFQRFVSYRSEINIVKMQYHTKIGIFPSKIVKNLVFVT